MTASAWPPRRVCVFGNPWPGGVGDRIIFSVFLALIRKAFPGTVMTYVANREDVRRFSEYFGAHCYADRVVGCPDPDDDDPAGWHRLAVELAAGSHDMAIFDPNGQEVMAQQAVAAGIEVRVGIVSGGPADRLLTTPVRMARPDGEGGSDLVDYAAALAGVLGLPAPRAAEVVPPFPFRPEAMPVLPPPIVAVQPGGAPGWNRRWPLARFGGLCRTLALAEHASFILVGASGERAELAILRDRILAASPSTQVLVSAGESLNRLACLLHYADVLVGNDSAPAHIAAAVRTPAVVLYGPATREFWWRRAYTQHRAVDHHRVCQSSGQGGGSAVMPCRYACHYPYLSAAGPYPECLRDIRVDEVRRAVLAALAAGPSNGSPAGGSALWEQTAG
jgi:ADP-heptose:LPS heptosyltransferase